MRDFLTEEQVKVLKFTHRTIKDKKLADRIKAVLSLNAGFEYSYVAKILLLDEVTLRRYVQKYQEKGVAGLLEYRYTGGQTKLAISQEQDLRSYLKDHTKRTAKEVTAYVLETYGFAYSVIGITKLLHRLGFAYKKPKIVPGKASRVEQEEFLKQYEVIKSKLKVNDQVYFLDSTHPQHNTKPSYGWILKGKENDKFVKTNSGRQRINLHGALSLKNHRAVILEEKTINHKSTLKLLRRLKRIHPRGKIYLVLDNASYYHAKEVKPWIKKHRRFKLVFLPSYSPNLNLIERLWRFFHQKVTWNHYFETFEEFRRTSLQFFKNLDSYKDELQTLMTDNFQLITDLQLQT